MKSLSVTIQMKATEQYFSVVVSDYAVHGESNVCVCVQNVKARPFKRKLLSSSSCRAVCLEYFKKLKLISI